ncbi:MAG: LytTR family DNA-binding domain-containing protein [Sediminibacterium sp.]|nr:LytTR family DNA-binding domain-containing protein [Sediminibacterium sp.]
MIKAIAIDDEPLALQVIDAFCKKSGMVTLQKGFTTPKEGLQFCLQSPPELLFLDIHMPDLSGLELIKNIPSKVAVVFTTAFDRYALDGYNLNAIDYLLKPFSYDRFMQSLQKVKVYVGGVMLPDPFLFIRADYSQIKVNINDIEYIEGLDDYVKIHIQGAKTIVARYTLKYFTEHLPPERFLRIHRSYIIPVKRITQIKTKTVFLGAVELPVGSSYESQLNILKRAIQLNP